MHAPALGASTGSRLQRGNRIEAVPVRLPLLILLVASISAAGTFDGAVRQFLARHCHACHGETVRMADLRLDLFTDERHALRHPGVWDDVLRMTRAGKMPPPGSATPSAEELASLTDWIERNLAAMAVHRVDRPGRVTARRLNRAEYDNTARDLLHVDLRLAESFPVDDSGYGFDNIGDVLSVSPLLMEKYIDAAGKLARAAIWDGPRVADPTRFRIQAVRDPDNPAAIGRVSPYAPDGSVRADYEFPAQGFYEFAFGAIDRRLRSEADGRYLTDVEPPPPRFMTMVVDGRRMATKAVEAAQYFDRTERVRLAMQPGRKRIWLGFVDFDGEPMDPNEAFASRKLWADYLEINGPFDAEPMPLPKSHRRIMTCRPEGEEPWEPCARKIIGRLALRAYRRPPGEDEMGRLMTLAAGSIESGESFEGMVQTVLQAVLVSPQYLFRIERDPEPGQSRRIDSYELASRLSYFLWSSMPDDRLLEAAAQGLADSESEIAGQVRRMLSDPKSAALVEGFAGQWLELRNLAAVQPDRERFPEFDAELRDAMRQETRDFFGNVVREDRSVLEFLDSDYTYLNGRLARHYGIEGVEGGEFRRVSLPDQQRGGLLGQASILTVSSYPTRTSPVLRGLWVLNNILGQPPPPPPPDVPELEEGSVELLGTLREQLEQHRADEGCMSCHLVMDAIGFGLENYDAVGRWRVEEGSAPVDSSGSLPGGRAFESPAQLRRILVDSEADSFVRTLSRKLLTYALGRGVDRNDNPAIDRLVRSLKEADHRFSALVQGIVDSKPFRMRAADSRLYRDGPDAGIQR